MTYAARRLLRSGPRLAVPLFAFLGCRGTRVALPVPHLKAMRTHSAIFPLYVVSRQGKYLYTVHRFTRMSQILCAYALLLLSFAQGILNYRGRQVESIRSLPTAEEDFDFR